MHGGDRKSTDAKSSSLNANLIDSSKTCDRIAEENGVSRASVLRASHYTRGIDIADNRSPGIKQKVLRFAMQRPALDLNEPEACMEQRGGSAVTCRGEAPPSAVARPFGRSKAPLGLLLLRKRELALAGRTGSSYPQQKKQSVPDGERPVVHIAIVSWLLAGCVLFGGAPCFFTMPHHFPRAASDIRHQHGSGSDAAHPGSVPIFCAGMPCKLARKQCHFPAYCPILSA